MRGTLRQKISLATLALVSAWFLAAYLDKTASTVLYFDSAWHGTVAKNLVLGAGYASSFDGLHRFDPDVTTGPVPILVAALAIKLFGNHYSLPLYVASLLNLVLALAMLAGVWRLRGRTTALAFAASFALLVIFYEERWWHIFTGDITALLLGMLGLQALSLALCEGKTRQFALAGLVLALALLSKLIAAVFVLAAIGIIVHDLWRRKRKAVAPLPVASVLALVIAFGVPLLGWQAYQYDVAENPDSHSVLNRSSVGLGQLLAADKPLQHLGTAVKVSHGSLKQKLGRYGLPPGSYLLLISAAVGLCIYGLGRQAGPWSTWQAAVALSCCGFWLWHLLLNVSPQTKYTLYPTLLTLWLVCLAIAETRARWYLPPALIIWIVLSPGRTVDPVLKFAGLAYPDDIYRGELMAMAAQVETYQQDVENPPLAACGWNNAPWPLEYVLRGTANFLDCHQHLLRSIRPSDDGESYEWVSNRDLSFTLVQERILWKLDKLDREKNAQILALCDKRSLYENEGFRMLRCRDEALRAGISLTPGSPFLHLNHPTGTIQPKGSSFSPY